MGQETSGKIARLEREIEELKKENERLRHLLEEALRFSGARLGNPLEGERDSVLKLDTIPL